MKELKELSMLVKEWENSKDISKISNESICSFLVSQKVVLDTLETLIPLYKTEFLKREIHNFSDYEKGIEITEEKENNLSEVNVEDLFLRLDIPNFLKVVNVVKSKATTPEQKAAILLSTVTIEKDGKIVKVKQLSRKKKIEGYSDGSIGTTTM